MSFLGGSSKLEAMGFSKAMAELALEANNGDVGLSVAWLFERAGYEQQPQHAQQAEPVKPAAEEWNKDPQLQAMSSSSAAENSPTTAASAMLRPPPSASSACAVSAVSCSTLPSVVLKQPKFAQVAPPPDILCDMAFSCEIMDDPVISADGHTYNRADIETWLQDHDTSPKTGEVLVHKMLLPNRAIREQLIQWLESNGLPLPAFQDTKQQQQQQQPPEQQSLASAVPPPPPPCGCCPSHPFEPLRVFCADCGKSVCTLCAVDVSACKQHRTKTYASIIDSVSLRLADVRARSELLQQQAMAVQAAGEEAKLIAVAAIDAQVQQFVRRLQHTDDTILGGPSADLATYLQAQLAQAVAATQSPPATHPPSDPTSQSALALASAYMTSELKAATGTPQFIPLEKELYRSSVAQALPPLGQIIAPAPSSPPHDLDCDMSSAPLPHYDFSQFVAAPIFDFRRMTEALPNERGANRGERTEACGGAAAAVGRNSAAESHNPAAPPQHSRHVAHHQLPHQQQAIFGAMQMRPGRGADISDNSRSVDFGLHQAAFVDRKARGINSSGISSALATGDRDVHLPTYGGRSSSSSNIGGAAAVSHAAVKPQDDDEPAIAKSVLKKPLRAKRSGGGA